MNKRILAIALTFVVICLLTGLYLVGGWKQILICLLIFILMFVWRRRELRKKRGA